MFSNKNTSEDRATGIDEAEEAGQVAEPRGEGPQAAAPGDFSPRSVSYIGAGLHVSGELRVDENLYIEGTVEGKVETTHEALTIGKKGRIEGDIVSQLLEVRGTVDGEIYSHQMVKLYASAVINGNIYTKRLVVEEGATFNGKIDMNWDGTIADEKSSLTSVEAVASDKEESVVKVAG